MKFKKKNKKKFCGNFHPTPHFFYLEASQFSEKPFAACVRPKEKSGAFLLRSEKEGKKKNNFPPRQAHPLPIGSNVRNFPLPIEPADTPKYQPICDIGLYCRRNYIRATLFSR